MCSAETRDRLLRMFPAVSDVWSADDEDAGEGTVAGGEGMMHCFLGGIVTKDRVLVFSSNSYGGF